MSCDIQKRFCWTEVLRLNRNLSHCFSPSCVCTVCVLRTSKWSDHVKWWLMMFIQCRLNKQTNFHSRAILVFGPKIPSAWDVALFIILPWTKLVRVGRSKRDAIHCLVVRRSRQTNFHSCHPCVGGPKIASSAWDVALFIALIWTKLEVSSGSKRDGIHCLVRWSCHWGRRGLLGQDR